MRKQACAAGAAMIVFFVAGMMAGVGLPGEPGSALAEDIIRKGEVLSLEQCIGIALAKQPSIIAAYYTVEANRSRVGEARSNYYPQISASGGYSRTKSLFSSALGSNGGILNLPETYNQYTSSVSLSQNIYDFGKTAAQVNIQKFNLDSANSDLDTSKNQTVLNVRQAYYGVLQAARNRQVAEESVGQYRQHLEQARGFFAVGAKPRYDVITAEVNLSNARLNLITADNALKIARVNLNNAMGVPDAPAYEVEDTLVFNKYGVTLEEALSRAMAQRPEIRSLLMKRKSAEENVRLAGTGHYPSVAGNASYNWDNTEFPLVNGWNVGVTLSMPIFNGFLVKHQVEEAESNLNAARANEEVLRQNVVLEVQQAYLNLKQYEDSIATADLAVRQATENLDISNGRYAAGVGNPIEVTDAQVTYSNAKLAYIQALTNYNVAYAGLLKAMGEK